MLSGTDVTVASALRQHAPQYLEAFGSSVPLGHRKVLSYIMRCRSGQLGSVMFACETCHHQHWVGRSCGNRHCPNCQKQKTTRWLLKRTDSLLPVQHFVVTFTVPQELRGLLRANQKDGYDAIFDAGQKTIRSLLANPKTLGTDRVGFFGALHTWGRDPMVYHPHVHFVVPGGGVSKDGSKWLSTPENFLFPHAQAIALYKKCFVEEIRKAGLYKALPDGVLKKNWVVDIKPVGDGKSVLKYLAPYIYRVAISDSRIVTVDEESVTYRITPSGSKQTKLRTVAGTEFVRGFVQHVLPSHFQKVRYYGWMSPNCKTKLELARWLVWLFLDWTYWLGAGRAEPEKTEPPKPMCRRCGGEMEVRAIIMADGKIIKVRTKFESQSVMRHQRGPPRSVSEAVPC